MRTVLALTLGLTTSAAAACSDDTYAMLPDETLGDAIKGGTILSESQRRRTGIVGFNYCTGTVLRTSTIRREAWILTAAHCHDGQAQAIEVLYNPIDGNTSLGVSDAVYPHPDFDTGGGRLSHDLTIIHTSFPIPIEVPSGATISDWYRPVLGHNPASTNSANDEIQIFGNGYNNGAETERDGTLRYVADEYFAISDENISVFDQDGASDPEGGDSGGPWLTAFGVDNVYPSTESLVENGLVIAVHSGEFVNDEYGSSTYGATNLAFLQNVMGDSLVVQPAGTNSWVRNCWTPWCYYFPRDRAALTSLVARMVL
jgi:hypothetical protein